MMEDGSQWMMLFRALGSLALVIGLIFALAYVAKRFMRSERWASGLSDIRIVQSMPIGAKKKIMLVEVEGKRILVGVGGEHISHLCDLEPRVASHTDSVKEISYAN